MGSIQQGGPQTVVEEDNDKVLVVTRRSTRLMLGVDCFLQLLPPLDGGVVDCCQTGQSQIIM